MRTLEELTWVSLQRIAPFVTVLLYCGLFACDPCLLRSCLVLNGGRVGVGVVVNCHFCVQKANTVLTSRNHAADKYTRG